jgi:hypothetical protein
MKESLWEVIVVGLALGPLLLIFGLTLAQALYRLAWDRNCRWMEAVRDAYRPWMWIERWVRYRFIHRDCLYWCLPVRLDRGIIEVEGAPPAGTWWSFTWYEGTEVNQSIGAHNVVLGPGGRYRIQHGGERRGDNWIPTRPSVSRAVLSLRIYEPKGLYPSPVPVVMQAGRCLAVGGDL